MTEKDLIIQDLREENRKLKEQLAEMKAKDKWIPAEIHQGIIDTYFYRLKTLLVVILEDTNETRMVELIIREMRMQVITVMIYL